MNTRTLVIILAVIVLLAIGYFVFAERSEYEDRGMATSTPGATTTQVATTSTPQPATAPSQPSAGAPSSSRVTVTYTGSGFSPATITVSPGTTVTFVNQTGNRMWVASDVHPTHTAYDGTSTSQHCANGAPTSSSIFDQCGAGSSFSFTFTKAGTWEYHNHANSSHGGTIVVR